MSSIPQIAEVLQQVLGPEAEAAGRASGFVQRQRKVNGANFTQTLVMGWLGQPEASLEELCQAAMAVGLEITPQGLEQRFTEEANDCLNQVLQKAVAQAVQAEPVTSRFCSASTVSISKTAAPFTCRRHWPRSGQAVAAALRPAAVRSSCRCDGSCRRGELEGPHLHDGRTHDRVATLHTRLCQQVACSSETWATGSWTCSKSRRNKAASGSRVPKRS